MQTHPRPRFCFESPLWIHRGFLDGTGAEVRDRGGGPRPPLVVGREADWGVAEGGRPQEGQDSEGQPPHRDGILENL